MAFAFAARIAIAHLCIDLVLTGVFVWNGWQTAQEQLRAGMISLDPWVMDSPPAPFVLLQTGTLPLAIVEASVFPHAHWQTPAKLLHWPWAIFHFAAAGLFWWRLASFRQGLPRGYEVWHKRFIFLRLAGFFTTSSLALSNLLALGAGLAWLVLAVAMGGEWLRFAARWMATSWGRRELPS